MSNYRLFAIALVVSADAGMQAGHSSWIPNGGKDVMRRFIRSNTIETLTLTVDSLNIVWSVFVTIRIIGQVLGAEIARPIVDKYGRRFCLRLNSFNFMMSNLMQLAAGRLDSVPLLFFGRLLQCMSVGVAQVSLSIFITEISPKDCRGRNASLYNVFIGLGSVLTILLANKAALGGYELWYWITTFPLITSNLHFIVSWFIPESPKFLIQHTGAMNFFKVKKSFQFYRNQLLSDKEVSELISQVKDETRGGSDDEKVSITSLFKNRYLRQSLLIMFAVSTARALSGYHMMFSYSTFAIEKVGLNINNAQWATLVIATLRFVFSLPLSYLVEKVGRRPLMICTSWGTLVCFFFMLTATVFYNTLSGVTGSVGHHLSSAPWTVYVGLVAELAWPIAYNLGIGPIPRFIVAEIFPQKYRAYAQKISVQWDCIVSFIFTFLYLPLFNKIGGWVYLIVIIPLVPLSAFMTIKMPETKNKDIGTILDEIHHGISFQVEAVEDGSEDSKTNPCSHQKRCEEGEIENVSDESEKVTYDNRAFRL